MWHRPPVTSHHPPKKEAGRDATPSLPLTSEDFSIWIQDQKYRSRLSLLPFSRWENDRGRVNRQGQNETQLPVRPEHPPQDSTLLSRMQTTGTEHLFGSVSTSGYNLFCVVTIPAHVSWTENGGHEQTKVDSIFFQTTRGKAWAENIRNFSLGRSANICIITSSSMKTLPKNRYNVKRPITKPCCTSTQCFTKEIPQSQCISIMINRPRLEKILTEKYEP